MADDLIDRIYEAAALPDLWPDLLADIAAYGGGEDALLFTSVRGEMRAIASPSAVPVLDAYRAERWPERTDRPARIAAARHHGFITDLDVYRAEDIPSEPVYRDFLIPRGWGWGIGTSIPVPTGDHLFVTVERAWSRGPAGAAEVGRLDLLRPHLARAALVSARLQLARARSAADALQALALPACVLGENGRILAMNEGCEVFLDCLVQDRARMTLTNAAADRLLRTAIETLGADDARAPRSIPVVGSSEHAPTVIHLIPIRRSARDLFTSTAAIAVFTSLEKHRLPDVGILEALFDLTPAEARVARAISQSKEPASIALEANVSLHTVKTQLKSVFSKTGTSRQIELALLLIGFSL